MKLKKGTLLFLLLTCLAYTTLAQSYVLQSTDVDIDNNGKITNYKSSNTNIIIPEKIGETTIEGIGDEAFKNKSLAAVVFEEGSKVTAIGTSAFENNQLTTLTLPISLTTIGESAFRNNQIGTLTLPTTVTTIGESAFQSQKNNSLTSVTFAGDQNNKSMIRSIGTDAFSNNTGTGLTGITLPELAEGADVTYKDSNDQVYKPRDTFSNFDRSLAIVIPPFYTLKEGDVTVVDGIITACTCTFDSKRIIIPVQIDGVDITGIGGTFPGIFQDKNLVSVEFASDSEVTTIGDNAFRNNQIIELSLPTTLTTINQLAFFYNQITELTLPTTLTTIRYNAFQNNKITELTLPASLRKIEYEAFYNNDITELTIPNNAQLETIGSYAFQDNQITELTFPENSQLTTIGDNAFKGNDGEDAGGNKITTLTLPPSLTVIGDSAFYNNSLTTVTFNDNPNKSRIKSIGIDAFSGNTIELNNKGITLPKHAGGDDVKYKDSEGNNYDPEDTFTNFTISLQAVIPTHTLTADDVDIDDEGIITKCHCTFVSNSIMIPEKIDEKAIRGIVDKSWPDGVFKEKNLIAVAFAGGSQITYIGESAFYGNKITELTLPTTLTTIGGSAFANNKITKLTFPEDSQLTSIGWYAFFNNSFSFTLPSVTKEGFRTYWEDGNSKDLGDNPTINQADFRKSFELVSIQKSP